MQNYIFVKGDEMEREIHIHTNTHAHTEIQGVWWYFIENTRTHSHLHGRL